MTIGIFGGSFDPIHKGHVAIARRAIAEFNLNRLLVIPAAVSPFKTDRAPKALGYDRLELVKAAFAGIPEAVVDDRELRRGGVSYAIDTVREIRDEYETRLRELGAAAGGLDLIFLIGEDSVAGLPRWKDYATLVRLCTFRAFPRTRESSTEVRRRLLAGESVADLVPPAVLALLNGDSVAPPPAAP